MNIPLEKFGYDHWATFGYIVFRAVDGVDAPNVTQLYCDIDRHPALARGRPHEVFEKKWPTTLRDGEQIQDHDDWDSLDDLVAAGLLTFIGTEVCPVFKLTRVGKLVAAELRRHKAYGGTYRNFRQEGA